MRQSSSAAVRSPASAILAVLVAAFAFVAPATATSAAVSAGTNILIEHYRAPDHTRAVALVEERLTSPTLTGSAERMRLIGFLAGLIVNDPSVIRTVAPRFRTLPYDQPMRLARAIRYSGRPDTLKLFAELKALWPEQDKAIAAIAALGAQPVGTIRDERSTVVIDLALGYFGATGDTSPIERIIRALPTHRTRPTAQHLLVAQSARWTLADLIARHPRVREICLMHLEGPQGEALREILTQAARPSAS